MPRWVKAVLWSVVIVIAVVVLFTWVFPWIEDRQQDPTIASTATQPASSAQVLLLPR